MLYNYANYIIKNMNTQNSNFGWMGWAVAAIIGAIFIFSTINTDNQINTTTSPTETTSPISEPPPVTAEESKPAQEDNTWHCIDATSYNQNAYDDNKCTKGNETKYVSDSQAVKLDSNYSPGKAGAAYYNNQ
jgi:hypothetical protein